MDTRFSSRSACVPLMEPDRRKCDLRFAGEEFVNRIMVGDCPACGSSETSDCENDPEIDDPCVARCLACGQLWCPDCGEFFQDDQFADHDCPAWEGIDFDDDDSGQAE